MKGKVLSTLLIALSLGLVSCNNPAPVEPEDDNPPVEPGGEDEPGGDEEEKETADIKGSGTENDPYLISNDLQLKALSNFYSTHFNSFYKITKDIDLKGEEWTPIGNVDDPFNSKLIGDGHTISNYKITEYSKENTNVGFFGYMENAYVENLTFKNVVMDINVLGKNSVITVGGLAGMSAFTSISGVRFEFDKYEITSLQNGSSLLRAGGIVGNFGTADNIYISMKGCSVFGDIVIDVSDADGLTDIAGGLVGYADSYYGKGLGIVNISNSLFEGSISSGASAAGIAGVLYYMCSVTNCIARGTSIEISSTTGGNAAGIAALAYYDSAILNTYVDFDSIKAPVANGSIKSFVSPTAAVAMLDEYEEYTDNQGCALYKNYASSDIDMMGNYIITDDELVGDLKDAIGLADNYWKIENNEYVPLQNYENKEVTLTINLNYPGAPKVDPVTFVSGTFDYNYAGAIATASYSRINCSFYGLTYDQEGEVMARWYVPANGNITLYAGFAKINGLIGHYSYKCIYNDNVVATGEWQIDKNYFYWKADYDFWGKYEYKFNGTVLFIGKYIIGSSEDAGTQGGYEGAIFVLKDGKLTGLDATSYEATYEGALDGAFVEIPTYDEKGYLGTWYSKEFTLKLYEDAQVICERSGRANQYGGFTAKDNNVTLKVISVLQETTFKYDETKDILYSSKYVLLREEPDVYYTSNDGLVVIAKVRTFEVVIASGELSSYTGTLQEGETVVVNGVSYTVGENELVKVDEGGGNEGGDEPGEQGEKTYLGTWTGKVGMNSQTFVFNKNGKVTFNNSDYDYSVNGNTITFSVPGWDITCVYNQESQTLKVTMTDEYEEYEFDGTLTDYAPLSDEPSGGATEITLALVAGTYRGTFGQTTSEIVLTAEGKGTIGDNISFDFTVDATTGVFTISNYADTTYYFDDLELTYNPETQKLTGKVVYDYMTDMLIDMSKVA